MTKHIYIVRHGETEYNRLKIIQGSGVDSELNERGRRQAQAFYQYYREVPFDLVMTSRLRRTHQTMQAFIEQGLPWEQWTELNEMNWGIHEGKAGTPALRDEYIYIRDQWSSGNYDARIEGGESAAELAARLRRFTEALRQRPESRILICSHGRAICALLTILQQQELYQMNEYTHANTGLWKSVYEQDRFHLELKNDTTHLSLIHSTKG